MPGAGPPGGVAAATPNFNVEAIDDLLQQIDALVNRLADQAAMLHGDARQNYQAVIMERQARLQARHLGLTRLLLALVVVVILAGPVGRTAVERAFALVQGAAAAVVFDPLFGRLLDGLLPPPPPRASG